MWEHFVVEIYSNRAGQYYLIAEKEPPCLRDPTGDPRAADVTCDILRDLTLLLTANRSRALSAEQRSFFQT